MKIRLFTIQPPEKDMPILCGDRFAAQSAGGGDAEVAVFTAHSPVIVKNLWVSLDAAVTGAATNNFTLSVIRYNVAGTLVGTVGTVSFASGTNAIKFGAFDVATLSAANLTNTVLAKGDTLTLKQHQVGTGLACPAGKVEVDYIVGGAPRY